MKRYRFTLFTLLLVFVLAASTVHATPGDRTSNDLPLAQRCGIPGTPACTPTLPPPRDLDGDGVPDVSDGCPTVPGPAANRGCPENTPVPAPRDRDGDGTPDDTDRCPDAGGPASNSGCPTESEATPAEIPTEVPAGLPTAVPAITLPTLPTSGDCALATLTADRVNLRSSPSLDAAIVGALDPTLIYPALALLDTGESSNWVRVTGGWVAGWVVRIGGACETLPTIDILGGNDSIWLDMGSSLGRGMDIAAVDGQIVPGSEEVSCSNNLHPAVRRGAWILDTSRDPAAGGGQMEVLSYSFGVSETGPVPQVTPEEWCVQEYLNPKGFTILSAGRDGAASPDPDAQGFMINWFGGEVLGDGSVVPTESLVIAHVGLKPSASNLPEADIPGIMLVWHIPHDPGSYEGTHALYQDIFIPTSDTSGLVIDWQAPPEPDAPANTSNWFLRNTNSPGAGQPPAPDNVGIIIDWTLPFDPAAQGIIIDYSIGVDPDTGGIIIEWSPNPDVNPGPPTRMVFVLRNVNAPGGDPDAQGFVVNWFPNGFDPDAQGIIIIGGMPESEESGIPRVSLQLGSP